MSQVVTRTRTHKHTHSLSLSLTIKNDRMDAGGGPEIDCGQGLDGLVDEIGSWLDADHTLVRLQVVL
jgi:hypothetical protein